MALNKLHKKDFVIAIKTGDTAGDEDKFKNFKSIAERMSLRTEQVAMIYLLKHMDSIRNYIHTGKESSEESILGRIQDARNYLLLLGGIIEENSSAKG